MKKKHKHEPDPTMEEICDNCGYGWTYCKNCDDVTFYTEDGGETWEKN